MEIEKLISDVTEAQKKLEDYGIKEKKRLSKVKPDKQDPYDIAMQARRGDKFFIRESDEFHEVMRTRLFQAMCDSVSFVKKRRAIDGDVFMDGTVEIGRELHHNYGGRVHFQRMSSKYEGWFVERATS